MERAEAAPRRARGLGHNGAPPGQGEPEESEVAIRAPSFRAFQMKILRRREEERRPNATGEE